MMKPGHAVPLAEQCEHIPRECASEVCRALVGRVWAIAEVVIGYNVTWLEVDYTTLIGRFIAERGVA